MTAGVVFTDDAVTDLRETALFLRNHAGTAVESRFYDRVADTAGTLAAFPASGRPVWLSKGLVRVRTRPVGGFENWLIFYRPTSTGIEVLRVLHGARDLAALFDDDR
jgi:toxin ParE1/3/4